MRVGIAMALVASLVAGCGGSSSSPPDTTPTPPATDVTRADLAKSQAYWNGLDGGHKLGAARLCKAAAALAAGNGDIYSRAYQRVQAIDTQQLVTGIDVAFGGPRSPQTIQAACNLAARNGVVAMTINLVVRPATQTDQSAVAHATLYTTRAATVTVSGTVDATDAVIDIYERHVGSSSGFLKIHHFDYPDADGSFKFLVPLAMGENDVKVTGTGSVEKSATELLGITRS